VDEMNTEVEKMELYDAKASPKGGGAGGGGGGGGPGGGGGGGTPSHLYNHSGALLGNSEGTLEPQDMKLLETFSLWVKRK